MSKLKQRMHVKKLKTVVLDSYLPVNVLMLFAEKFLFFDLPNFAVVHCMRVAPLPHDALFLVSNPL